MKTSHRRSGFTLLEMTFVLVIMGLLALYLLKWSNKAADDAAVKGEYLNAYRFEAGINNSFSAILDSFEGVCGTVSSDATASMGWGWGNASCQNTSLLPLASGNSIVYSINFAALSATAQASLKNEIATAYSPMCSISGSTATSLTLSCGGTFSNLQYDSAGGLVNQYHTAGTNFNFIDTPVPVLTLKRSYSEGSVQQSVVYRLSLSALIQQRSAYTTAKFENVGKMLKTFYNTKLALETQNTSPAGLNSGDDELSPWFWEAFGDIPATASVTVCSKNAGTGVCDNLNTNNIWRSNTGDAILWRRLIAGLGAGDFKYTVDGFGNALRIIPILSQCAASNLSLCTPVAPTVAKEPYPVTAVLRPPYTTLIYSGVSSGGANCADLSTQASSVCRYPIVY